MKRVLVLLALALTLGVSSLAAQESGFSVDTLPVESLGFGSALSPDGHTLAIYDYFILYDDAPEAENLPIHLIDTQTGESIGSLSGHSDWVTGVAFTSDGSRLASFHRNGDLLLWDVAAQSLIKTIRNYTTGGSLVQFMNDDRMVLYRAGEFVLGLLDTETGAITRLFGTHFETFDTFLDAVDQFPERGDLMFAAWMISQDGEWLATSTANDEVMLWDMSSDKHWTLRDPSEQFGRFAIRNLVFSSDSRELTYFDQNDEQFHVWDVNAREEIRTLDFGGASFALAPDNTTVAWADRETGTVYLADTAASESPVEIVQFAEDTRVLPNITSVSFTSDGAQLVISGLYEADEQNAVYVINLNE